MALQWFDGFDNYGSSTNAARSRYSALDSTTYYPPGRFNGKCMCTKGVTISLGGVYTAGIHAFAVKALTYSSTSAVFTYSGAAGAGFRVTLGGTTGTVTIEYYISSIIGWATQVTGLPGSFSMDTWYFVEIKWSSSGGVIVRVNGAVAASTSTALSLTSSLGSIYSCYTGVSLSVTPLMLDDMYLLDTTTGVGAHPMNDFIGDKRVITLFPSSNGTTSWSPTSTVTYVSGGTMNSTNSYTANTINIGKYTATVYDSTGTYEQDPTAFVAKADCVLNSITIYSNANYAGCHIRPVLYTADPASISNPKTLLARGDETTGLAAGANVLAFGSTAPTLTKGTRYFLGFICDTAIVLKEDMGGTWGNGGYYTATATYPTAPTTFAWGSATLKSYAHFHFDYTVTLTNYQTLMEDDADTLSYNTSSTLNAQDLYNVGPSMSTAATIYAVQVSGCYKKDDANVRTVANLVKSSTTQAQGTNATLGADYAYKHDLWVQNPATSTEWTASEVNAAQIGYKITT